MEAPLLHIIRFVHNIISAFSGTSIFVKPWTALLYSVKVDVEVKVGCIFDYAVLNLYQCGHAKIELRKEKESCLESGAPVVCVSFGIPRTSIFERRHYNPVCMSIEGGNLFMWLKASAINIGFMKYAVIINDRSHVYHFEN